MLAEPVTAEEAVAMGMIWRAVDDEGLLPEAERIAGYLAGQPTAALVAIRQAMDESATRSLDEQLEVERRLQAELGRTDDYAEGVSAFMEKRKPRFGGRA